MARRNRFSLRRIWVQIHLWLGLTLGVVGVFIGLSGSILVFDHDIDGWLHPARYEISGSQVALPYSDYAERAAHALEGRAKPTGIRLPDSEDGPIMIFARAPNSGGFLRVYLDPPTGRVLDVTQGVDFIGWMHSFHESLTLREYMGREIVGVVGIAMLISALSGIYLWWPARGQGRKALGFRTRLRTGAQSALHVRLLRLAGARDALLHRHLPRVHRRGARSRRCVRADLAFAAQAFRRPKDRGARSPPTTRSTSPEAYTRRRA